MTLLLPIIIVIAIVGLITKLITDRFIRQPNENDPKWLRSDNPWKWETRQITWSEYIVVLITCSFIIAPTVVAIWNYESFRSKIQYMEYRNGWETSAQIDSTTCHKNGSCRHTYECDPHPVSYSCNCHQSCSGSGSNQSCTESCDTCYRTEYDDCPYCDKEYDYTVTTSLGNYVIDSHRFPENPNDHRWRERKRIPEDVIESAGVGAPDFWKAVDARLKAGKPGFATKIYTYENYIYAADYSILKQYSGDIDKYRKILPRINVNTYDYYMADKVYFVGFSTPDRNMWIERLNYLNAATGSELQGDIHLVLVKDTAVANPDEFTIALRAYWQKKEVFGKKTLPKNTIIVIFGTDGKKITWGRAFTGMPLGNEELQTDIMNNFKGADLTVDNILGNVHKEKGQIVHTQGLLECSIYGLKNKSTKFKRVSMKSKDQRDIGSGFLYLQHEIEPSAKSKIWCLILCVFLSGIGWAIAVNADMDKAFKNLFAAIGADLRDLLKKVRR